MEDLKEEDICRVCRAEGTKEKPLYHPCICTGSIKYIHQECLVQWLKHSKKEYCELCTHRFTFKPIYAPDMPTRLPVTDFVSGLIRTVLRAVRFWFHYILVAFAWLGVVPLTAYRIYRCLFAGTVSSLLTLPLDMLSTENLIPDCIKGCFVVACTLCAFISLVWLREQIVMNGGPAWLEPREDNVEVANDQVAENLVNAGVNQDGGLGENEAVVGEEGQAVNDAAVAANAPEDENNWNPVEWDRAAEELTWERMLGLDGSLLFLEHVFWVVSLNTSFILVFAFCPFHIGYFATILFSLDDMVKSSHLDKLLTTVLGYIILAATLVYCHSMASLFKMKKAKRILGLCYIIVKVSLLMVVEIGVFPLVCGWWLDICSLPLFGSTLKSRQEGFHSAPGTSLFLHWLVGMVFVFYFASFVLLLREVIRPGVLWFLRNLNDPDFHPVQEMVHLPLYRHARRFLLSMVVFGTTVMLMVYLPVQSIRHLMPMFLPYNIRLSSEVPMSELSLELLLLQVILPALLEQGHTRQWLKGLVRGWLVATAYFLDLRSYLIGDVALDGMANVIHFNNEYHVVANQPALPDNAAPQPNVNQAAPPAGHGEFREGGRVVIQPYIRPERFTLRITFLIAFMCLSLAVASFLFLTLPVAVGRFVMHLVVSGITVHELYTAAFGLYIIWLLCRTASIVVSWLPLGVNGIVDKMKSWTLLVLKCCVIAIFIIGVIPFLLGLIFELVVVSPLRVGMDQSPLYFPAQDWALGVLHTKIICAMAMMGPEWWLKRVLDQIYQNGLREMDMTYILQKLIFPVTICLMLMITTPYVAANLFIPLLVPSREIQLLFIRQVYPFLLAVVLLLGGLVFQGKQFQRLYEHIKNDKYLIGRRLVNYEHSTNIPSTSNT
ncbi:E3 ubiquitin- ligase MARCH6 isoform X1 [Paramuricea clavata]|uniref:E3 ubiquitin-protein ligase MARCHF6 n=1 Tax=Paramuricea clavata TaxID=317549 RepID=A0A6S7GYH7_PARCT|nr:E3 ubiquitin- ligase MARCH6 isoform X1 [Paramuricea clavata]